MDTNKRKQQLCDEIDEISNLIEKSRTAPDPDTRWAVYLLKYCQEQKENALELLMETENNSGHSTVSE